MSSAMFTRLEALLNEVNSGVMKTAAAATEPTGVGAGSDSASPSVDLDDQTHPAKDGERGREMNAEMKRNYGSTSINSAPEPAATGSYLFASF